MILKMLPSARAASLRLLIAKKKAINSKITHKSHKALNPTVAIVGRRRGKQEGKK